MHSLLFYLKFKPQFKNQQDVAQSESLLLYIFECIIRIYQNLAA